MRYNIFQYVFKKAWWCIPTQGKEVFLTFDDGPHPEITPWILELLKQHKAKASFFVIGKNTKKHPEIIDAIVSAGHVLGYHTYNHLNGWQSSLEQYLSNVEHNTSCKSGGFFRPPYGKLSWKQYQYLSARYQLVMWSVLSKDYNINYTAEQCYRRVISRLKPGDIIVFHDSEKAWPRLKECLPMVLETLHKKGYRCSALPEPN